MIVCHDEKSGKKKAHVKDFDPSEVMLCVDISS